MASVNNYVRVYEASDAGTGDPAQTFWQFFVGAQPVFTKNPLIAQTMRLAVKTESKVRVEYDPNNGNTISQARMEFTYVCDSVQIHECMPGSTQPGPPRAICTTKRY